MKYSIPTYLNGFIETVVRTIQPSYSLNDKAHDIDHAKEVCYKALELNATVLTTPLPEREVVVAALCHDMFAWSRNNHHDMAYHWLMTLEVKWIEEFTPIQRERIALASKEHRSSYMGQYSSKLSELIATSDRGVPTGAPEQLVYRSLVFRGWDKTSPVERTLLNECITHVIDKYGTATNRKFPQLWLALYGELYDTYRTAVDYLTINSVVTVLQLTLKEE